jgi:hypothetical protein
MCGKGVPAQQFAVKLGSIGTGEPGNKNWQWQKYIPDDRTGTDLSGNSGLRNVV